MKKEKVLDKNLYNEQNLNLLNIRELRLIGRKLGVPAPATLKKQALVEYILKVASLFRNPLAMISPSTVVDLVNIPEGRFDEIKGEMKLEDNVIKRMKITSRASELTSLIYGRYDLTTNDANNRY